MIGVCCRRDDDLARPQHGDFVGQCLRARRARGIRRRVNSPVERSISADADTRPCAGRDDRHQKRGLACVQITGVRERARRDDAHDFAPDEPLAFFGSSTCSQMATRKPFLTSRAM